MSDLAKAQESTQHFALMVAEFYNTLLNQGVSEATAAPATVEYTRALMAMAQQQQAQQNGMGALNALIMSRGKPHAPNTNDQR